MSILKFNDRKSLASVFASLLLMSFFVMPQMLRLHAEAVEGWWNPDWLYRKAIVLDHTKVEGDQENFPVLIDVVSNSLNKSQANGDDIVFTDDDSNRLSHEIEFYDSSSGQLVAWVNVPLLSSTTDTILYMYYGNPYAENQQNTTAVWDSGHKMALHLDEKAGRQYDSTVNANNGTAYGGVTQGVAGKIDGADSFDGVNDYIRVLGSPSLAGITEAITVECWVNFAAVKDVTFARTPYDLTPKAWGLDRTGGSLRFYVYDGGVAKVATKPWTPVAGNWYYIVGRYDGNRISVYVDGVEHVGLNYVGKIGATDKGVVVGAANNYGGYGFMKGFIDEIRISNSSRPIGWMLTSYNNQKDPSAFYTIENEEIYGGAGSTISDEQPTNGATGVYTNPILSIRAADANGDLMTIVFSTNASGTWEVLQSYNSVGDGIYYCPTTRMDRLGTTYYWNVNATDGNSWTSRTHSFTTTNVVLDYKWTVRGFSGVASGVLIADVNGDGFEEVIHTGLGGIQVLNGTDGGIIWTTSVSGIGDWCQPQMADLNKDGILEIVVPLQSAGIHVLYANNGSTYWRREGLGGVLLGSPVVGDIDGDGYPTIFVASSDTEHGLDGYGRVTSLSYDGRILHQTFSWRPCAGGLSLADTDRDGEFELYMGDRYMYYSDDRDYGKGVRSFWAKNLTSRWEQPDILCSSHIPMIADVNKDGVLDVIACDQRGGIAVLNSTDGSVIRKGWPGAPGHYQPSVHDIDGDGNLEILMAEGDYNFTEYNVPMDQIVVWDLFEWKKDANMTVGQCRYGPQVADVTGDGIMEIIDANYSDLFVFDRTYSLIAHVTGLWGPLNYAVVQDIDGDQYNELVISSLSGSIYAYDTPARRSTPRARSEVQFYSERRLGAAEYVPPPGGSAPYVLIPSPDDKRIGVPISLSQLSFDLKDFDYDLMNYSVVTYADIGCGSGMNVANGRYTISISNLSQFTTYTWTVSVTDGKHLTNQTYSFTTNAPLPWWNGDWHYRKAIIIDHRKVKIDQGFPVLVELSDMDLGSAAQADGDDIVFTDCDGNKLNHETELFDSSSGRLVAWVSVPMLSSTEDTVLYLYYGNPYAESQQNPSAVWDSSHKIVLHLDERSGSNYDSTVNANNGTAYGGVTQGVAGKIDGADSFDGANDYVRVLGSSSLAGITEAITVECWVNFATIRDATFVRTPFDLTPRGWGLDRTGGKLRFYVYDGGVAKVAEKSWTPVVGTWYYIVGRYDGNRISVYVDGIEYVGLKYTGRIDSSDKGLVVGAARSYGLSFVQGIIDEIRISNLSRPAGWILTSYNNQQNPSTFYTTGDQEQVPEKPVTSIPSPLDDATDVHTSLGELSFSLSDYQDDLMNYTVATFPDIGSGNGLNVANGRYYVSISGLVRSTIYTWTVSVTDGAHWTNRTYSFTTYLGEPPKHDAPILVSSGGTNTTGEDLICHNQTTFDPEGDEVTNIYNWYRNNVSMTNLLLPFDTNSSPAVKDYSGYNNNGMMLRGISWTGNGLIGGAYKFDRGYIKIPGTGTLDGNGQWGQITVEHWIYLSEDQGSTRTIAKLPSYEMGLLSTNKVFVGIWVDTGVWNVSGYRRVAYDSSLQKNRWYHVAFTYDNRTLILYVDGVERDRTYASGNIQTSGAEPLYIGWFDYFKGMIDEVRIYNESLSRAQIRQRYQETKDGMANSSTIVYQETEVGDVWKCEVTPNDGYQDGITESSNSIVIESNIGSMANDLPTTPTPPWTSDGLVAGYAYFSPEVEQKKPQAVRISGRKCLSKLHIPARQKTVS